jgi:ABC-2 type transport system ATP-binding protein
MNTNRLQAVADFAATSPKPTDYVIETEKLELRFGKMLALKQLDLKIPRGRIHAIVGANGAGKSSLFRILLGVQSPSSGVARILGHDSASLSEHERARIGYVNEEHAMPPWLRVSEVVQLQRTQYSRWDDAAYRRIVGHFHVLPTQRISELSRGERAGVNLAMALAQRPELLMLDEPTLGLDVVAKRGFLEILLDAVDDAQCTILYCSHQMEEVERLADNLIILERGELVHMSPPDEFCNRVSLWVAEFAFVPPDLAALPGVLQTQRIDGLFHLLVLDEGEDFGDRLASAGARRHYRGDVNLDRAVNAFLTRHHAMPT